MTFFSRSPIVGLVAAAVLLAGALGGVAAAQIDGDEETIFACAKTNGQLRLVADPADCRRGEEPIWWNQIGPPGEPGPAGETGPRGEQGEPGQPGNLALAGQMCPDGETLRGFDEAGDIVCTTPPPKPPLIEVVGENPLYLEAVVDPWIDPGAIVTWDDVDDPASLTAAIVSTDDPPVDSAVPGIYEVHYSVTDSDGLVAGVTREVIVRDTLAPVIALNGPNPIVITWFTAFSDPGASVTDLVDGTWQVFSDDVIDTSEVGLHDLTYVAVDNASNHAEAIREVEVSCQDDVFEPNDSFGDSTPLGTLGDGSSLVRDGAVCLSDADWFAVSTDDATSGCFPGTSEDFRIEIGLDLDTAPGDLDLYLYGDEPTLLLASSLHSGNASESIVYDWEGVCGADDDRQFTIEIDGRTGHDANRYELSIQYWEL